MNNASRIRLAVGKELGEQYAKNENIEFAFVGGSVARGVAEGDSDIDIGVIWKAPPTEDERRDAIHAMSNLDTRFVRVAPFDDDESYWWDDFFIGQNEAGERASGLYVEISHYTCEFLDSVIQDVTKEFDPEPLKQNLFTGILGAIPIAGESRIEVYQDKIRDYPDGLARAIIERYAQIDFYSAWKKFIRRGENLYLVYQQFCEVQEKLLYICLALSRTYSTAFTWINLRPELIAVAPADFIPRMRSVFSLPPDRGAEVLKQLVHETYDLIETQFPDAKVDWWRSVFDWERTFWEEAPCPIS